MTPDDPAGRPAWVDDLDGLTRRYRTFHRGSPIVTASERFAAALEAGRVALPADLFFRCAPGGHLMLPGALVRGPLSGRVMFSPSPDLLDGPAAGVYVLQNGNPTARGKAATLWGTIRLRLTCPGPGCAYAPEVYTPALTAAAMVAVMEGERQPLLDF